MKSLLKVFAGPNDEQVNSIGWFIQFTARTDLHSIGSSATVGLPSTASTLQIDRAGERCRQLTGSCTQIVAGAVIWPPPSIPAGSKQVSN